MKGALDSAYARLPGEVWIALALVTAGLVVFSQTLAIYPDEGFHLLAAKLINAGKVPYRDFFYQHPPLFAYIYAGWMQVFGETWRSAHLLSALLTAATVWLVTDFVVARQSAWRRSAGIIAIVLIGLNMQVMQFGTVGHPYAPCMLLSVLAFRLVVGGNGTAKSGFIFLAGIAAGGAVLCSPLVAPIIPLIAIWLLLKKGATHRFTPAGHFLGGVALWLLPLSWFFFQAPRPFLFDLVEYHLFYRGSSYRTPPPGYLLDGLNALSRWLGSGEGLPRLLLALFGIWSLFRHGSPDDPQRAELRLAAGIVVGLGAFISIPYPTFPFYFVVVAPFLCILACHGALSLASTRWLVSRSGHVLLLVAVIPIVFFVRAMNGNLYLLRAHVWRDFEDLAAEVNRVVPANAPVFFPNEISYFVSGRLPPTGLENRYGSVLNLSPDLAASVGIVSQSQIDAWIKDGRFAAVWMYDADPRVDSLRLGTIYNRRANAGQAYRYDGYLFWDKAR